MTVGSVAYAAPEQLTGKTLDGRADQYALACTAFHLLTGGQPFANSNPAVVIGNHLSSPPPRLGSLRADLGPMDNVLAKAMAKEPFQRFDTCRQFAAALSHGDAVWNSSTADTQFATTTPAPPRVEEYPGAGGAHRHRQRLDISHRRDGRHRCRRFAGRGHCCVRRRAPGAVPNPIADHTDCIAAEPTWLPQSPQSSTPPEANTRPPPPSPPRTRRPAVTGISGCLRR